jgi:coronin-7
MSHIFYLSCLQPRLGPRPFTSPKLDLGPEGDQNNPKSNESNFDRVFSVPAVPAMNGTKKNIIPNNKQDISDIIETNDKLDVGSENEGEEGENDSESRTPTTAERRRMFEQADEEAETARDDKQINVEIEPFKETTPVTPPASMDPSPTEEIPADDSDCQITSIAERRRLYENRSMSVQEPASISPTPLRRRDSLKGNNHEPTIKEEPVASRKQVQRQSSLESKKDKKPVAELATPTPKRTSTVFGKFLCTNISCYHSVLM